MIEKREEKRETGAEGKYLVWLIRMVERLMLEKEVCSCTTEVQCVMTVLVTTQLTRSVVRWDTRDLHHGSAGVPTLMEKVKPFLISIWMT